MSEVFQQTKQPLSLNANEIKLDKASSSDLLEKNNISRINSETDISSSNTINN